MASIMELFPVVFIFTAGIGAVVWWRKSLWAFVSKLFGGNGYELLPEQQQELISHEYFNVAGRKLLSFQSIQWSNILRFKLNGKDMEIVNPDPSELLAHFVREKMSLKGTKLGCEEGGCGACSVVVEKTDGSIAAANSCLRLLCLNDGASLTTVEGVGSVKDGLSPEQQSIVSHNGTQCGYCTPGWVTAMHALSEGAKADGKPLNKDDIDKKMDGNLCRCTGYRPIMHAFHTLCDDNATKGHCSSPQDIQHCKDQFQDIEEMRACPKAHSHAAPAPVSRKTKRTKYVAEPLLFTNPATGTKFYRPVTFDQLCSVLREYRDRNATDQIQLVGGNTSIGVTKYLNGTGPYYLPNVYPVMIDTNSISELHEKSYTPSTREIVLGAALSVTEMIAALNTYALPADPASSTINTDVNHNSVFAVTANHFGRVANTQVRNFASWAGNVMMFLQYRSFASDVVLALTTANATLKIADTTGLITYMPMADFLTYSFADFKAQGLFLVGVVIKESIATETVMETFKMARREHNAHAFVDVGCQFQIRRNATGAPTCTAARIVFGAVAPQIFIATATQAALIGKPLDARTLQAALTALQADWTAAGGVNFDMTTYNFITSATPACLYRMFLRCYPAHLLPANLLSVLSPWQKPRSRGVEVYPVDRSDNPLLPIGKAVTKLEAPIQATGEAIYPSDEALPTNGLFGAIVFSSKAAVPLVAIDASAALAMKGVVAMFTAADIPGSNATGTGVTLFVALGDIVHCSGAPLGVIVAETEELANKAAYMVKVTYGSSATPAITNITQAVAASSFFPSPDPGMTTITVGDSGSALTSAPYRAQGKVSAAGQNHFYMEAHAAIARLIDGDKVDIICGTQMPSGNQDTIASILQLSSNQRVGGAFGGKITGGVVNAAAAGLCVSKLRRAVRIFNTRTADMNMQGGREEWMADYDVGFTADGRITALNYDFFIDAGAGMNDCVGALFMGMFWADNAYYFSDYTANATLCYTNTPPRTSMRAPGVVQASLITEMVVERVAAELRLPLRVVQERNFIHDGQAAICGQVLTDCTLADVWAKAMARSQFDARTARINVFNSSNLWRKRGLACCPVKYGMGWAGYQAGVKLGVHLSDGCVVVAHSGVEIGQGINTKVAQAVASALGVDMSLIRVERTSTTTVVNGGVTGGSGTSEVTVQAALNACDTFNKRIAPFRTGRTRMTSAEWVDMIHSLPGDISLNTEGWYSPQENPNKDFFQYFVYAAAVTEVELNVLSGEVHVLNSELVYDCGRSLNPAVDIGQIEGALIQGIGYFFHEKVFYEEGSGVLRTAGTWEYKPPMAQDIPSTLNVTLIANAYNKNGIVGSKAVAEPPYVVSNSAYFALKMAISSARTDAGVPGYFNLPVPCTVDDRQVACLVGPGRYVMPM